MQNTRDPKRDPREGDVLGKPDHGGKVRERKVTKRRGIDVTYVEVHSLRERTCMLKKWFEWAYDAHVVTK